MTGFVVRRLLGTLPTLIGISLVTFVILALSMRIPDAGGSGGYFASPLGSGRGVQSRFAEVRLPLFLNLSIEDARARAGTAMAGLRDQRTAAQAKRTLAKAGGAWLPHIIPALGDLPEKPRGLALDALDEVADRIDMGQAARTAPDRAAFWKRYWERYGSDFQPVRAARLVRRLIRRDDRLARAELRRLDTYCLPQVMEALAETMPPEAQARLIRLASELIQVDDPLDPADPPEVRQAVLARWRQWWEESYDRYTVFEGLRYLTGTVTETRYFRWLVRLATFDFGVSLRDGRPIASKLAERLPVTLLLSFLALLLAYGVAVPVGVLSAVTRGSLFDRAMAVAMFVIYSLPAFWIAMVLLRYLSGAGYLDWFPAQGLRTPGAEAWAWWRQLADIAYHLVLPVFCLSLVPMAMLARYQRAGMIQVIHLDFMRTARAKGLSPWQAILKHGLRNGVIPVITMLGLQIPHLVSGSVVVERIFGIPGMGYETFEAIRAYDQPWLLAVVAVTAIMTLFGVVMADVIYALIDPRIMPGEGGNRP